VGQKYQSADYGDSLQALFQILENGVPQGVTNPGKLALTAELLRRPIITAKEVLRFFPDYIVREKYPQVQTNKAALNLARLWELERYRQNTVGAGWKPMLHQGDVISPNYEYRFEVNNRCETPLYYYLIAHDGAGIVQWISPKNATAGQENPRSPFTFGQSPLAVGTKPLTLPENREFEGHAISYGWPAEGAADQQFFLVVTPAPWKELEAALTKASTLGFQLYKTASSQGQTLTPVSGAIPSLKLGLRAVGSSEQMLDLDEATPTVAEAPGIITRTDGNLLVYSWHVKMVSAEQMHPENRSGQ
jgi:hypothetical protein